MAPMPTEIALNPTSDRCVVSLRSAARFPAIEVVDARGAVLLYLPVYLRTQLDIPVSRFAQGVYTVRSVGPVPVRSRFVLVR